MNTLGASNVMPVKNTVATEISYYAEKLASLSQALAEKVHQRLHPVMRSPAPTTAVGAGNEQPIEYPPLFAELRDKLTVIEASLNAIDYALSLVEL